MALKTPDFSDAAKGRRLRSQRNYLSGTSAEGSVERWYADRNVSVLERRWRGKGGEIDLILTDRSEIIIFAEVKASRDFDAAIARITPRQVARIHAAASEYLEFCPKGQLSETRFDVALVNGQGQVRLLENALLGY